MSTPNTPQPDPAAVARYADTVMAAIREDMDAGIVPKDVTTFAELHDHVDANMYVIDALGADFGVPEHDGDEYPDGTTLSDADQAALDAEVATGNAVMDEVNRRLSAPPAWCRTCGNPVENGRCVCWCHVADALQRYLGRDFDHSAQEAAEMWDALDPADKARVWRADYADDHDVPVYPEPAAGIRVTIGDDLAWTFTAASVDEERWNGWACPWFTDGEARKIAAASKAAYEISPGETQEYIAVNDTEEPARRFWLLAPDEDQDAYPVESRQDANGEWLYAIGAANWTWSEAR